MKNEMNVFEVEKLSNYLKMYAKEIELNLKELNIRFDNLINYYKTNNSVDLEECNLTLEDNFKKINNIYTQALIEIDKSMQKYIETTKYVNYLFENNNQK